jgi:hypothetical protein
MFYEIDSNGLMLRLSPDISLASRRISLMWMIQSFDVQRDSSASRMRG